MFKLAKATIMIALLGTLWLNANCVAAASFDQEHSVWNGLLQTYVVDHGAYSEVRYRQIKQSATATLDEYLQSLSAVSKSQFDGWSQAQRLAFLINAYNAFTVKLIVDHYPVDSIKDLGGFFTSPWKIRFFNLFGGKTYLDHIEHDLIRGRDYHEPRIHFALVCASVGCPKLQSRAYTAKRLETMLESASETFLRDTSRNRYDAADNTLYLSSIFKWYGKDFAAKAGSVKQFVAPYISDDPKVRQRILSPDVDVEYLDYDWSLNDAGAH
jgi:hypothetical protein